MSLKYFSLHLSLCAIFATFSLPVHAQEVNSTSILMEHLSRVRMDSIPSDTDNTMLFDNTGSMMESLIAKLRKDNHLCENRASVYMESCLKTELPQIINEAYKTDSIDEIEWRSLLHVISLLEYDHDKLSFIVGRPNILNRAYRRIFKKAAQRRAARTDILPILGDYEDKKNHFKQMRIDGGLPAEFDTKTNDALRAAFLMKIKGAGRVDPAESVLTRYTTEQIVQMSKLIREMSEWKHAKTATLVIDKTDRTNMLARIDELQTEIAGLTMKGADSASINADNEELLKLEDAVSKMNTRDQLASLKAVLYLKSITLANLNSDPLGNAEKIKAARLEMKDAQNNVDAMSKQLDSEVVETVADRTDLYRVTMDHLEIQLDGLNRSLLFKHIKANYSDLIVASYLTGDTSSLALTAILTQPDFIEHHESIWMKTGKFLWSAGRMYLMMNPYTTVPTTLIVVVTEAIKKKKEYEKEQAKKTYLFRQ